MFLLATEVFGHELPSSGIGVIGLLFVIGFFFVSRGDNGTVTPGGRVGRGRMYQCTRCGRNFQPETVELLQSGDVRTFYDDRCPNCGWDLDWGNYDKRRPGGSSGTW